MERYKNLGGDSGIIGYEIGVDSITVQFRNGSVYLYNNLSTGNSNIDHMKSLAVAGHGLNSFISTRVKTRYAAQLR